MESMPIRNLSRTPGHWQRPTVGTLDFRHYLQHWSHLQDCQKWVQEWCLLSSNRHILRNHPWVHQGRICFHHFRCRNFIRESYRFWLRFGRCLCILADQGDRQNIQACQCQDSYYWHIHLATVLAHDSWYTCHDWLCSIVSEWFHLWIGSTEALETDFLKRQLALNLWQNTCYLYLGQVT